MATSKRKTKRKTPTPGSRDAWHLNVAFKLGKTAHTVSRHVKKTAGAIEKKCSAAGEVLQDKLARRCMAKPAPTKGRVRVLLNPEEEARECLSPIVKEMKAISEISGLTAAVREMNEISARESGHPAIERLLSKIKNFSPEEQEMFSRKFVERLHSNPAVSRVVHIGPAQSMTEEESRQMSEALIECTSGALGDVGVSREELELLRKLGTEVMRPLEELVQFYLKPKTFSQKLKRLWKLQRIIIKMVKLIRLTESAAAQGATPFYSTALHEASAGTQAIAPRLVKSV